MSNTTPPGWYPDGQGGQRYWDGSQWAAAGQGQPGQAPQAAGQYGAPAQGQQAQYGAPQGQYGAPQGQQGQYGAPGGFGQQPKSKTPLYVILGVVALLVVGGLGFLVFSLLGGGGASDDPKKTVENFIEATKDEDCDAASEMLSQEARDSGEILDCDAENQENFGQEEDVDFEVGDAEIDGDNATVPVTITASAGDSDVDFSLVREDGKWYVDDIGLDIEMPGMPEEPEMGSGGAELATPEVPTDIPTDPFSDLPTDFGTDFPTDLFSDFPTDLFSDFPTDFPS